jgi:predicted metal-dependent phosphoesterase TrpH
MNSEQQPVTSELRWITADLHVHTALSPCGGDDMTPPVIVAAAVEAGLDMIAICDHNTAGNAAAVQEAAEAWAVAHGRRLVVLAGMEITSAEEVHVVGLFPDAETAESAATEVRAALPPADDQYYSFFGPQPILNCTGETVGSEGKALALASAFDLDATVALIKRHGGLAVAAHVDRRGFGLLSQLGYFPKDSGFDGVEVSRHTADDSPHMAEIRGFGVPLTGGSDAHYPHEVGACRTVLMVEEPTFAEVVLAFRGTDGRSVDRA